MARHRPLRGRRGAAVVRLVRVPAAAVVPADAIPLEVTGLARHYGRLVGLAHFDLELAPGQCVALIGANGSGKSTAVRTISGLLEPTATRFRGIAAALRVAAARRRPALRVWCFVAVRRSVRPRAL